MKKTKLLALALASLLAFSSASYGAVIEPGLASVLPTLRGTDEIPVIVTLADKVDVKEFKQAEKALRRAEIIKALRKKAEGSQKPIIGFIEQRGAKKIKSLWATNSIALSASVNLITELASMKGVESIRLDYTIKAPSAGPGAQSPAEWNISAIRANELWALGQSGAGVVVASMDTGVDALHPDLSGRWRGGTNSWYDPGGEHLSPYDAAGHGTQTMGVVVGGNASGSYIGIAPGAQWIAAKIFNDTGYASFSGVHLGFQWLLDPDGNPDTDDAPDVANNSWTLDNINGCQTEFQPDIQILKASGTAVVFSAGNFGPNAPTSTSPANNPDTLSVGATDQTSTIATFSSRGPSACDGSILPDLVAPGVNIRTSDLTAGGSFPTSYTTTSGTSYSAPHLSGAMALLSGAYPGVTVQKLEESFLSSATDLGIAGPDNVYGSGAIDVMKAYSALGTDADGDTFKYFKDCNDGDPFVYPGAPETKQDGIDQDCNGYDLTINVVSAVYASKTDSLTVAATSALMDKAALSVVNLGPMSWNTRKLRWEASFKKVGGNPGIVVVSGTEGSETAQTVRK